MILKNGYLELKEALSIFLAQQDYYIVKWMEVNI